MTTRTPERTLPTHARLDPAASATVRAGLWARLQPVRRDWRVGLAAAAVLAGGWGVVAGWWTPRGPLTSGEALAAMAVSGGVGLAAGLVSRSRWASVVAPVVFAVVFELVRLDLVGPTVDAIHATEYGLFAFVAGRGFHALVALVPMLLGAVIGAGMARHLDSGTDLSRSTAGAVARRSIVVLTVAALVALAVGLARPARTDPIVGADGQPLAGSIAELTTVEVGGRDLGVMLRGHDTDAPVLLFLAGGPGGTELGAMRRHLPALEEHFVVATWDQRGTGHSYPELDPTGTVTPDGYVADTIAVTEYLRERFRVDRIHLMGQSWGSLLGVLAIQQRPDLYEAWIGTGQMVNIAETDRIFYDDTLTWARQTGNATVEAELEALGPPPYDSILHYEPALKWEKQVYPYDHSPNSEGMGGFSENLLVEEYALIDQFHAMAGMLDTFTVLYPQVQDIDLRDDATRFDVPVYLVQGAHEADGRAGPVSEWFGMIQAPVKELVELDTSGHRPPFEQPDEFVGVMVDRVLADTS